MEDQKSRRYFCDRLFWCIARMRSLLLSLNDDVLPQYLQEKENLFSNLEQTLEVLEEFSSLHDENTNEALNRAEMMMMSKKIREQVEIVLSSSFMDVVLDSDRNPIVCLSKNLFDICSKFVEEFSLAQRKEKSCSQKMIIYGLEKELLKFENFINDALLRMIFEVFDQLAKNPIGALNDDLSKENFQLMIERLIHIGNIAAWFSFDNWEETSIIKSCLTSIEAIYPLLTRPVSEISMDIIQLHFEDESEKLQNTVHKVIDSKSFAKCFIERVEATCDDSRKSFDKLKFVNLLSYAKILLTNFQINSESLKLTKDLSFPFNDFKLILNECEAILRFEGDESAEFNKRILKRFNILKNALSKLLSAMNNQASSSKIEKSPEEIEEITKNSIKENSQKFQRKSLKHSLRMQVLKKNLKIANNQTGADETSLEVTEILNKLTVMSTTLNRC